MIITSNLLNNIEQSITLSNITPSTFNIENNNGVLSMSYNQIKNKMLNQSQFGFIDGMPISAFGYSNEDDKKYQVYIFGNSNSYFYSNSADENLIYYQNFHPIL